jgi:hypothetical protein
MLFFIRSLLIALSLFFLSLNWNIHSRPRVLGTYVNNSSKGISFNETLTFKDDNTFLYFLSTATMERYSEGNYSIKNNKILFNCGLMTRPGFINIDGSSCFIRSKNKICFDGKTFKASKSHSQNPTEE